MLKILIVGYEENQKELYIEELMNSGCEIEKTVNCNMAFRHLMKTSFDLVIIEMRMPEIERFKVLFKIIFDNEKLPVIIYTKCTDHIDYYTRGVPETYLSISSNVDELKGKINELMTA
jgi:DNA-binding NtrC family response regulator